MIEFKIDGHRVVPANMKGVLMASVLDDVKSHILEEIGAIRDSSTGDFPTIAVLGKSIDDLCVHVEGSDAVVELVKQRFEFGRDKGELEVADSDKKPIVFLSYAYEDAEPAECIARSLQGNGIDTWWDKWCIRTGDSLRQKIDEGLSECTHFLVLLTPQSINKPWVNQEMDAGLVKKLKNACEFLPVRYDLPADRLPSLLSGMNAPEITDDEAISQLVSDIHGITRKPLLGPVPDAAIRAREGDAGYSPAANRIAEFFVVSSINGLHGDPRFKVENLAQKINLTIEDTKDGLYELRNFFSNEFVLPSLFAKFDKYWQTWDTEEDAGKLAANIANDPNFPEECDKISVRYGWAPRRLNPAVTFLYDHGMLMNLKTLGSSPYVMKYVSGHKDKILRFLKGLQ